MDKSNRSRWSNFFHDLVEVDFSQVDLYAGIRFATLLVTVLVVGLITRHVVEAALVLLGTAFVLEIDAIRSIGPRTLILLAASLLYASIFAVGMIISMSGYLVVPLFALGLFIISYFRVFPGVFMTLMFGNILFTVAILTQGSTPNLVGQFFLLIVVGGLWAIMGGIIFPANRFSKPPTVAKDTVQKQQQQQPQPKSRSWQDKFKPFASNLSIHSQYFQNALVLAITGVVGILITQWFDIPEGDWVLITIVIILMPAYTDISLTFNKIVHRLIGTTIGTIIAAIIIDNIDNQWLLSLFLFLFASIFVSCSMKTKNYAFELIFLTAIIIITDVILEPITYSTLPLVRIENIFIGCLLSLVAAFIIWIIHIERKPTYRYDVK